MPRDPVEQRLMKQQRLAKIAAERQKQIGPSPNLTIHVLGNGGPGNPACLFVASEHKRYIFNCGEGTQRLANEHGMKLSKLENVFLTQPIWRNIGGLPGMCMTLQSIGMPDVTIHSPSNVLKLFEMTKLFSVSNDISIKQRGPTSQEYIDNAIKVKYIPISKPRIDEIEMAGKKIKLEGSEKDMVLAFLCNIIPKRGTLDIVKCIELGVPRGPALGELKRGLDVKLKDGRIIKSKDVTAEEENPVSFLVVDCPSVEYLDSFLTNEEILRITKPNTDPNEVPVLIIHFTPPHVLKTERYKTWIENCPESVMHQKLNEDNRMLSFVAQAVFQERLRTLDPEIFPKLKIEHAVEHSSNSVSYRVNTTDTLETFDLRKPKDPINNLQWDPEMIRQDCLAVEGYEEEVRNYQEKIHALNVDKTRIYPIITFLGTGSAIPGKDRNTSCIFVKPSEDTSIIMDCGEQSYGQLVRHFGVDAIGDELKKLKLIFISHIHADHQIGIISILLNRAKFTDEPVTVIGPKAFHMWLERYDATFEKILHTMNFEHGASFFTLNDSRWSELRRKLDLTNIQTFRVQHCKDSYGMTITVRSNVNKGRQDGLFKISYSGDAMPTSTELVSASQNADVLIHEATMEDGLEQDARIKRHSTTSQAIDIGLACNAKNIILTHFSQRYAKLPNISAETFAKHPRVSCAFDNMVIRRHDLPKLPFLFQPLTKLFKDHVEFNEARMIKRSLRDVSDRAVLDELRKQRLEAEAQKANELIAASEPKHSNAGRS